MASGTKPARPSLRPIRDRSCCAGAVSESSSAMASIAPEDEAAEPAGHHGEQDRDHAIGERIIVGETEDRLLEAGFYDRQLRRGFLQENAVLEQEGPRLVRADGNIAGKRHRRPEQVLREELYAADALIVLAGRLLALPQRVGEFV